MNNYQSLVSFLAQKATLGVSALLLAAAPLLCHGQNSIGVNFAGRQWSIGGNTPQSLLASDTAGVAAQQNWNNVDPAGHDSGGLSQILGPNAGVLSDSSGVATGLSFSYSGQGMWSVNQSSSLTGNAQLMNGYSDVEGADSNIGQYLFGNLSFNLYDVYVYVSADSNGRTAGVNLNGGSQVYLLTDANGYNYANPLLQATASTQGAAASGQYVLFENVSGASLEVDLHRYGNNVGVAGIQIVPVPEPAALGLVVVGLGLLGFARRHS